MINIELPEYKRIELIAKSSPDYISFSQGAVKVGGTPQEIKNSVKDILETDLADYYQPAAGILPLRQAIANMLSQKNHYPITYENVIVTHGAIGGITTICLSFLMDGDDVLLPCPTYPSYHNVVKFSKANPLFVEAIFETPEGWIFDIQKIKSSVTPKTKMIILPNPSNPCGFCLSQSDVAELIDWCEENKIYLVMDEVYDHFVYEGKFTSVTVEAVKRKFVMRTGSFSKDYAMSGWRVGYIVAPMHLVSRLITVQDGCICCPNVIGQYAALNALGQRELIQKQVEVVWQSRELVCELLEPFVKEGIFKYTKPQAGIFLFLKTREESSHRLVMDILREAKVALVPGKDFGRGAESYIRFCFARDAKLIEEGINRLKRMFKLS